MNPSPGTPPTAPPPISLEEYARATLNILEDFATEKTQLEGTQRAMLNILEDSAEERGGLEAVERAMLNILEDSAEERGGLEAVTRAMLNVLEDSAQERGGLETVQRAMLNILEDFSDERARVEAANRELRDALESIRLAKEAAEAANRELEAFAYSVSHDLRAPLRAMDGFSLALLQEYGDKIDAEATAYLTMIRESSQTMAQLIDDLLSLSRVARVEVRREHVDLSEVVERLARGLQAGAPERRVSFVIQPGVTAEGDPRLLQQVLQNLLQNAWKFTAKHARATLEFGVTTREGSPVYFVRDDGAGFDARYAHKLFGVFQRLHSTEEFEGTGIGLAIVQRIVYRHGGRIWAEGEVEQGAAFYFTL